MFSSTTRMKIQEMHMRGWDKVNKEEIYMISKAVSTLKLRMARVTFDWEVRRIESMER